MAHQIESMAYAGQEPWHKLGTKVSEEARQDYERFLIEAGLDWTVTRVSLQTADLQEGVDDFAYAIRRSTDLKTLGVVGPRFEPLQNREAFEWFEPFVASGECRFETAGSLFGGARVWILAEIMRSPLVILPGDEVKKYLLLSHAHDGSLSVNAGVSAIRVVCNNTLSMALGAKASLFKTRHTQKIHLRLETIREKIAEAEQAFSKVAESYRFLASRRVSEAKVKTYVRSVMGLATEGKLSTKADNIVSAILTRVYDGIGQVPQAEGTWWSAYNGITEYLSHERGHSDENRLNSLWFGDSAIKNDTALEQALELAAV